MCRNTLSVSWEGEAHDCDFNQMLKLPLAAQGRSFVWDLDPRALAGWTITTGDHALRLHRWCRFELRRSR